MSESLLRGFARTDDEECWEPHIFVRSCSTIAEFVIGIQLRGVFAGALSTSVVFDKEPVRSTPAPKAAVSIRSTAVPLARRGAAPFLKGIVASSRTHCARRGRERNEDLIAAHRVGKVP